MKPRKETASSGCYFYVSVRLRSYFWGLLYLFGLGVNTDNKIAKENRKDINDKITKLRSENFFSHKISQNIYNSMSKRKRVSDILSSFESSMDSTVHNQ